ncbi:MAG: fibronectin type III domain-containing protein [Paludibacter sp.]
MRKIDFLSFVIVTSLAAWTNIFTTQAQTNSASSDVWEVEIVKKSTNEVVVNEIVAINSLPLEGLEQNTEYFARVRTKNFVFSGWATLNVFTYNSTTGITQNKFDKELVVRSEKGRLIISSTIPQQINIYNINGYLIRSLAIVNGVAVVDGLEKGVYLANNRKVIVE